MRKLQLYKKVIQLYLHKQFVTSVDIGKSYDAISKNYDNYFLETMHQYNDKMLRNIYKQIHHKKNLRVLDLAAGTGHNSYFLIKLLQDLDTEFTNGSYTFKERLSDNYSFTLVDISSGMLQKAYEKLGDQVEYIESDMLSYLCKCESESFDLIICSWAIKYQDPAKIITECKRILKQGGHFAVIVNTKNTLPQVREIFQTLLERHVLTIDKLMLELPNPRNVTDFENWFLSKGFKKITSGAGAHDFKFDSTEKLTEFVTSTGALAGFDRMIDLRNKEIQKEMTEHFKQNSLQTVTHHFVYGIYQK
ncbi:MAG: Methyltransferase type 11 [Bacillales bacterium]|jgi:ubiquinone/menaquinone biosynthesis C-methylase UbiE|nr:Methyltransferase type 11 [Bacillales bacterium]